MVFAAKTRKTKNQHLPARVNFAHNVRRLERQATSLSQVEHCADRTGVKSQ